MEKCFKKLSHIFCQIYLIRSEDVEIQMFFFQDHETIFFE